MNPRSFPQRLCHFPNEVVFGVWSNFWKTEDLQVPLLSFKGEGRFRGMRKDGDFVSERNRLKFKI
jgi:hypothetical protein